MTKDEAVAKIEMIEGMTGSRAVALVDALDALGLLRLADQLADVIATKTYPGLREIKDGIKSKGPLAGVDTYDALGAVKPEVPDKKYG